MMELCAEDRRLLAKDIAAEIVAFQQPVLTRSEAKVYTKRRSDSAFARFVEKHRVVPCEQGFYSRAKLDQILNKLSKQTYKRKVSA